MATGGMGPGAPRLVAVDLDGTLLTSDKRVTPRARRAVSALERRGVAVVLCTGRPPRSAEPYAAELGLQRPFICYNGAALYDPVRREARVRHHLDAAVAREALTRLRGAFPGLLAGVETDHGWYLDRALYESRVNEARLGPEPPTATGDAERFLDRGAIKLFVRAERASGLVHASEMAALVADLPLQRTWSAGPLLEILDPRVDKRTALADLCAGLGIARGEVAAFGDQRNDVEMLGWAGWGVAVANAAAEVRAVADEVTLSNDEDGVAAILEGWLREGAGAAPHQPPTGG